jgi:hypothetical protein
MPGSLNRDLLQRLEAAWRAQGALIADALAPGLTDAEMDHLTTAAGLKLPAEAQLWWSWHNGVTTLTPPESGDIGPNVGFYSLPQALEELNNEIVRELAPTTWLPLAQITGGLLCIDCAAPETAPVHRIDWQTGFLQGTDTMGETIELWLRLYETHTWAWNPAGWWDFNEDRAPDWIDHIYIT